MYKVLKDYKASRPKTKREETLRITVSPLIEKSLSRWFSLVAHKAKFVLEQPLPSTEVNLSTVENDSISGCPYNPTCSDKDFSEDDAAESCSGFNHHI